MRALFVHDADGKAVSVTVIRAGADVQGEISQVVPPGHRLTEVDITQLVESERTPATSEQDAVARAISRLMMNGGHGA